MRFYGSRSALIGGAGATAIVLLCLLGPLVSPYRLDQIAVHAAFRPPSFSHWLGTDRLGRDVLLQVMVAGRMSLTVGAAATLIMVMLGGLLGVIAGYFGSWADSIISRVTDVFMALPRIPLLVTLAAVLSDWKVHPADRIYITMAIVGATSWPKLCRLLRGQTLVLREMEYMQATTVLGLSASRKMMFHLLPSLWPTVIVFAALGMAGAIAAESTLSFLGLGVVPPNPSWGNMISSANTLLDLQKRPWLWIPPGFFIFATTLSVYWIGEGLRNKLHIKERGG